MDPQWAEAFRLIPYGIYVLTTKWGAESKALIVSWVSQVSYSPPLLLVALRFNRPALPAIRESGFFSLSLLKKEQKPLVVQLKDPLAPLKFSEFFAVNDPKKAPLLKEAAAFWECRLFTTFEVGDHILLVGEVLSASASPEAEPLTTADYGKTYIGQS